MKCRATLKRFWDGVMVGPGSGNEFVDYQGEEDDRPEDFIIYTDELAASDKAFAKKEQEEKDERSRGLLLHEYTNPRKELPPSGGGNDDAAKAIRKGDSGKAKKSKTVKTNDGKSSKVSDKTKGVSRAETSHESVDQSKVAKDDDGKVLPADTPVER